MDNRTNKHKNFQDEFKSRREAIMREYRQGGDTHDDAGRDSGRDSGHHSGHHSGRDSGRDSAAERSTQRPVEHRWSGHTAQLHEYHQQQIANRPSSKEAVYDHDGGYGHAELEQDGGRFAGKPKEYNWSKESFRSKESQVVVSEGL